MTGPQRTHHTEPSTETVVSDHIVHVGDIVRADPAETVRTPEQQHN